MLYYSMVNSPQMFTYSSNDEPTLFKPGSPKMDPFLMSEKEEKKAYYEEQCAKYGTRDWSSIKQRQAQEKAQRKQEYEVRKAAREKREKERAEWWEKNKDRIEREWEERHRERMRVAGERWRKESAAASRPVPGAWRTANRPDGW